MSAKTVQVIAWELTCDDCGHAFVDFDDAPVAALTVDELASTRTAAASQGWNSEAADDSDLCPTCSGKPARRQWELCDELKGVPLEDIPKVVQGMLTNPDGTPTAKGQKLFDAMDTARKKFQAMRSQGVAPLTGRGW